MEEKSDNVMKRSVAPAAVPFHALTGADSIWTMVRPLLLVAAFAGLLLACGADSPARAAIRSVGAGLNPPLPPPDTIPEVLDYNADLGVNITEMAKLPGGVLYQDMVVGAGREASPTDSVEIAFLGWLPDGSKVDSGMVSLRLGSGAMIQGIETAIPGMKPGGRRKLVIPPGLAYGSEGQDAIPPNAVVVYEVELRAIVL
jgi:FKBP-type peptidyl-prolyl cis-trans isomerase FkpA